MQFLLAFVSCVILKVGAKGGTVLYPWGPLNNDHSFNPPPFDETYALDDNGGEGHNLSHPVNLTMGKFKFFNVIHDSLTINKQGIIYFGSGHIDYDNFYRYLHPYHIKELGEKYPAILPLLGEVDPVLGYLFYRETRNKTILQWAAKDVKAAFPSLKQISIDWAFVVTWYGSEFWEPEYYRTPENCKCIKRLNSFQAVLVKSGERSFVIFNYEKLEWARNPWPGWAISNYLSGQCKDVLTGHKDNMSSIAGFVFGEGSTTAPYLLPGSQTENVLNLTDISNLMPLSEGDVGMEGGKWVFRVDTNLHSTNSCSYADEVEQLRVYPAFVCQLGHIPLKIKGPCLTNVRNIECRFHEDVKTGAYFSNGTAMKRTVVTTGRVTSDVPSYVECELPLLATSNGRVKVELAFTRHQLMADGSEVREDKSYFGSLYSHPPFRTKWDSIDLSFSLTGDPTFSWDPNYFQTHVKDKNTLTSIYLQVTLITLDFSNPDVDKIESPLKMSYTWLNNGSYTWALGSSGIFNNPKAGYFAILSIVRDTGNNQIDEKSYLYSPTVYRSNSVSRDEYAKLCDEWYQRDQGLPESMRICPPLMDQADLDANFVEEEEKGYWKAGSVNSSIIVFRETVPNSNGNCQRCMYNRDYGKLLYTFPSAATAFKACPEGGRGYLAHHIRDVLPRHLCNSSESTTSMGKYYTKRQTMAASSGVGYVPPKLSLWRGDPHFTTFDNVTYTFNAIGTFWLMKSLRSEAPSPFEIQGRMGQYGNTNGSVFTAFTISGRDPSVHVQVSLGATGLRVWLNQQEIEVDTIPMTTAAWEPRPIVVHSNGTSLRMYRRNNSIWAIERVSISVMSASPLTTTTKEESTLSLEVSVVEGGFALNVASQLSSSLRGKGLFTGLLGDFDGNPTNDLRYSGPNMFGLGVQISVNSSLLEINKLGLAWRTTAEDSLFVYDMGKLWSDYQNLGFTPILKEPNTSSYPKMVLDLCSGNKDCFFDYAATNSLALANATKVMSTFAQDYEYIMSKKPPIPCQQPNCPDDGTTTGRPTGKPASSTEPSGGGSTTTTKKPSASDPMLKLDKVLEILLPLIYLVCMRSI